MNNMFQTIVTVFPDVTAQKGINMPLGQFLSDECAQQKVKSMREHAATDAASDSLKELKKLLPCATISSRCEAGRKEADPFEHTGLICVDIDGKDNPQFPNGEVLKSAVCSVAEVAYCSLSASGHGCFAIIRIAYPEQHAEHFRALERLFRCRLGIAIDRQCGNIKRLRFATFDPDPYVNDDAPTLVIYDHIQPDDVPTPPASVDTSPSKKPPSVPSPATASSKETDFEKVGRLVDQLVRHGINLTEEYNHWINVGMSLTPLGEAGRNYFHALSSVSSKYTREKTDSTFTELLRTTHSVTLRTFFHLCREHGLAIS